MLYWIRAVCLQKRGWVGVVPEGLKRARGIDFPYRAATRSAHRVNAANGVIHLVSTLLHEINPGSSWATVSPARQEQERAWRWTRPDPTWSDPRAFTWPVNSPEIIRNAYVPPKKQHEHSCCIGMTSYVLHIIGRLRNEKKNTNNSTGRTARV